MRLQEVIDCEHKDERAQQLMRAGMDVTREGLDVVSARVGRSKWAESVRTYIALLSLLGKLDEVVDYTRVPGTRIVLRHIPGDANPADVLTKPEKVDRVRHFMMNRRELMRHLEKVHFDQSDVDSSNEWLRSLPCGFDEGEGDAAPVGADARVSFLGAALAHSDMGGCECGFTGCVMRTSAVSHGHAMSASGGEGPAVLRVAEGDELLHAVCLPADGAVGASS